MSRETVMLKRLLQLALVLVLVILAYAVATWRESRGAADGAASAAPAVAPSTNAAPAASVRPQRRLAVAFRLDPAVTRSLYLGDRWVSPPTFRFAQSGDRYVVQAKLQHVDPHGERVDLSGDWSTPDPGMIAIERHDYGQVTLVIRRAGTTQLRVSAGGASKVLPVHATRTADAMEVTITQ